MISRRNFLEVAAAVQLLPLLRDPAAAAPSSLMAVAPSLSYGPSEPFDFERLKARVKALAAAPYQPPPMPDPAIVATMTYDDGKNTRFKLDDAMFGNGEGAYPVIFTAVNKLFPKSVRMYRLDGGSARELLYKSDYFEFPAGGPFSKLPAEPPPMAGFELRQAYDKPALREHEGWASFAGASYFRAVGEANQYGMSARGVAQNSGIAIPEEFPDFTHFWIGEGAKDTDPVTVYALLDGPSLSGAYRFLMHRGRAVTMEITCELTLRKPIERLGIAPMTSMYWYSESVKGAATDWRPEVHDSDGLAIWTGAGEHIWRPLIDPEKLQISAFVDENPRGFGLMQRDKVYDHYLDAVHYEKRPCAWVEPMEPWGHGTVQLVEIPTDNEIYDNIIAMWVPAEPNRAGQTLRYGYRLLWRDRDPQPGDLAICTFTGLGAGAVQGAPRSKVLRKFMVDFEGAVLGTLDEGEIPEAVLTASRGRFLNVIVEPAPSGEATHWRVQFDLDPEGPDVVELRCFLRYRGRALTETWLYRYIPFVSPVR